MAAANPAMPRHPAMIPDFVMDRVSVCVQSHLLEGFLSVPSGRAGRLYRVTGGRARLAFEGNRSFDLEPDDIAIVKWNHAHTVIITPLADVPCRLLIAETPPQHNPLVWRASPVCVASRASAEHDSVNRIRRIVDVLEARAMHQDGMLVNDPIVRRLFEYLVHEFLLLDAVRRSTGDDSELAAFCSTNLIRSLAALHADLSREWSIDQLSGVAGLCRTIYASTFRATFGTTPMRYVAGLRMERAAMLLRETKLGIAEVAIRVGYESVFAFTRSFRRHHGFPPGHLREETAAPDGGAAMQDGQEVAVRDVAIVRSPLRTGWSVRNNFPDHGAIYRIEGASFWFLAEGMPEPVCLEPGSVTAVTWGTQHVLAATKAQAVIGRSCGFASPLDDEDRSCPGPTMLSWRTRRFPFVFEHLLPRWFWVRGGTDEADTAATLLSVMDEISVGKATMADPTGMIHRVSEALVLHLVEASIMSDLGIEAAYLPALKDRFLAPPIIAMHKEPQAAWTVESLATMSGLSRSPFAKRFSDILGMGPIEYLFRLRMRQAQRLMQTEERSLADIAELVGYESSVALHRAFLRFTGQTPGAYRRAFRTGRSG